MYRPDDLTQAAYWALIRAGASHKTQTISAVLHDLDDDQYLEPRRLPKIIDGEIDSEGGGRSIHAMFYDPKRRLHGVEGIQAARYILQVRVSITVEELDNRRITFPAATMALDECTRQDNIVTMTGRTKAALHMRQVGAGFVIPAGTRIVDALRRVAVAAGEKAAAIDIVDRPARLARDHLVGALSTFWHHEQFFAHELDLVLFYNQAGRLICRPPATAPLFTFRTGPGGYLTAMPAVPVNYRDFHNEVWLSYGHDLKRIVEIAAPENHPLSRETRAWHGQLFRKILHVERKTIKEKATALRVGHLILDRELLHSVTATAESYPFWFLEYGDLYRVRSRDYTDTTTIPVGTQPLVVGRSHTLGWTDVRSRGLAR